MPQIDDLEGGNKSNEVEMVQRNQVKGDENELGGTSNLEPEGGKRDQSIEKTYADGGESSVDPKTIRIIPLPGIRDKEPVGKFASNYISTTTYSLWSFVPFCLFNQFLRFSNCYFLFVTILQCIPVVSPLNPWTAILPMLFVMTVALVKEAFEDYARHRSD